MKHLVESWRRKFEKLALHFPAEHTLYTMFLVNDCLLWDWHIHSCIHRRGGSFKNWRKTRRWWKMNRQTNPEVFLQLLTLLMEDKRERWMFFGFWSLARCLSEQFDTEQDNEMHSFILFIYFKDKNFYVLFTILFIKVSPPYIALSYSSLIHLLLIQETVIKAFNNCTENPFSVNKDVIYALLALYWLGVFKEIVFKEMFWSIYSMPFKKH